MRGGRIGGEAGKRTRKWGREIGENWRGWGAGEKEGERRRGGGREGSMLAMVGERGEEV
jgi:hypothetical protein